MKHLSSQMGTKFEFDVVVIGAGIAGLSFILALLESKPKTKICLISKKNLTECNSNYAQGGIAAVTQPYDSTEKHITDTLKAGDGLCDKNVVTTIITHGEMAIKKLISYGVNFDNDNNQNYDLTREGGHSNRRIFHAGDHTGTTIMRALIEKIQLSPQITILENHSAINLIEKNSSVLGAYVLNEEKNLIDTILAKTTILATGGAGKVFRYTSNIDIATGDGIAMAHRVGAKIKNIEFFQFHPTLLYHHNVNNFLITEALRGEGAYLLNANSLERFMKKYAPEKMELATRDIVARAIFNEIESGEKNYVYLDVRHLNSKFLQQRFPTIFDKLLSVGIDIRKNLIPVVPAAHYLCGGIITDIDGTTNIKRLYALGETACTGFHGANRLASNSLLEAAVMGQFAATAVTKWLKKDMPKNKIKNWSSKSVIDLRRASQISAHWRGLRGEMTSYGGIIRTEAGLNDLLKLIRTRKQMIEDYYWKYSISRDLIELRNIILVAELIVKAALKRKISKGGHFRED